jgi:dCMP deaminase
MPGDRTLEEMKRLRLLTIQEQVLNYPHFEPERDEDGHKIEPEPLAGSYEEEQIEQGGAELQHLVHEVLEKMRQGEPVVGAILGEPGTLSAPVRQGVKVEEYTRPDWDQYFLQMLPLIGARATCNRGRSGCLIVKNNRILMSGYVGSPPGMDHCDDVGHEYEWRFDRDPDAYEGDWDYLMKDVHHHCIRTIHAEANAIYHCARAGVSCEGATIYCTMTPCRRCAEAIVQVGITRVVTAKKYHDAGPAIQYFEKANVELVTVGDLADYGA